MTLGLLMTATGCGSDGDRDAGGDGFPPGSTCSVSIAFAGGVDASIAASQSVACGASLAFDSGISFGYIPVDGGPLKAILIEVDEIERQETGPGFPTVVTIHHRDDRRWQTGSCEIEVLENTLAGGDDFADFYRTRGNGTCASPATAQGGTDAEVTIGDFAFVVSMPWTK